MPERCLLRLTCLSVLDGGRAIKQVTGLEQASNGDAFAPVWAMAGDDHRRSMARRVWRRQYLTKRYLELKVRRLVLLVATKPAAELAKRKYLWHTTCSWAIGL